MASLKEDLNEVREHILDLYLDVKVRSNDELNGLDDSKLVEERQKLRTVQTKIIIDYIRSSIEILLNLKMEDQNLNDSQMSFKSSQSNVIIQKSKKKGLLLQKQTPLGNESEQYNKISHINDSNKSFSSVNNTTSQMGYEEQMQQYEADIRNHISIEQQLKIYIDNLKYKMECDEKEFLKKEQTFGEQIQQLQRDKGRLDELIGLKEKDLDSLRGEIKILKEQVSSTELKSERMRKETLQQAETKYKGQMNQMQEELERFRSVYSTTQQLGGQLGNLPFNSQFEATQPLINYQMPSHYQTGADQNMPYAQALQMVNFYNNPSGDDHVLQSTMSKQNQLLASSNKKSQLSLSMAKSNNKILGAYTQTLSTQQSTSALRDTPSANQNINPSSGSKLPHSGSFIQGPYQNSFTNPRNSTQIENQKSLNNNSMDGNKMYTKKTLMKNHSEYFITNPNVKDIVENTQKSFRNKAAHLFAQGILQKKTINIQKSPEKNIAKSNLYKMTLQKSQDKFNYTALNTGKRFSQKTSSDRLNSQLGQSSFNQSLSSSIQGGHHKKTKTANISQNWINNTISAANVRQTANSSHNMSRDNSQSKSRLSNVMPANNQANYTYIKQAHTQSRTVQDHYDVATEDSTHKIPNAIQSQKDQYILFRTINEDDDNKGPLFKEGLQRSMDGGTQNIKSMKNLKATILGNSHHIKQPTKFKVSEKDIQQRNSQLSDSQPDSYRKPSVHTISINNSKAGSNFQSNSNPVSVQPNKQNNL